MQKYKSFLKNLDGYIAYAPEVHSGKFINLDNKSKKIACSYNSLLSCALEDSSLHAIRAVSSVDFSLNQQTQGKYYNSLAPYVISGVLKEIEYGDPNRKRQLLNSIKLNLAILQSKNPELDIPNLPEIRRSSNLTQYRNQDFHGNR